MQKITLTGSGISGADRVIRLRQTGWNKHVINLIELHLVAIRPGALASKALFPSIGGRELIYKEKLTHEKTVPSSGPRREWSDISPDKL